MVDSCSSIKLYFANILNSPGPTVAVYVPPTEKVTSGENFGVNASLFVGSIKPSALAPSKSAMNPSYSASRKPTFTKASKF